MKVSQRGWTLLVALAFSAAIWAVVDMASHTARGLG